MKKKKPAFASGLYGRIPGQEFVSSTQRDPNGKKSEMVSGKRGFKTLQSASQATFLEFKRHENSPFRYVMSSLLLIAL